MDHKSIRNQGDQPLNSSLPGWPGWPTTGFGPKKMFLLSLVQEPCDSSKFGLETLFPHPSELPSDLQRWKWVCLEIGPPWFVWTRALFGIHGTPNHPSCCLGIFPAKIKRFGQKPQKPILNVLGQQRRKLVQGMIIQNHMSQHDFHDGSSFLRHTQLHRLF